MTDPRLETLRTFVSTAHMDHLRRRERAIALDIANDGIRDWSYRIRDLCIPDHTENKTVVLHVDAKGGKVTCSIRIDT